MKKLFIHIGTHKTGTSALQRSLISNCHFLESSDFHFLEYSLLENAHTLRNLDYRDKELLNNERLKLEKKINDVKEDNVILSCEEYFGNLDNSYADAWDMAYKLAQVTKSYPRQIIVYIRRQDEFIESSYAQYIKQGASYSFDEFVKQYDIYQFDWFRFLETYVEFFGEDNLIVRPYEKHQLNDGDVVRDFYKIIGISSLELLREHSYSNHGYSRAGLEIARVYNRLFDKSTDKKNTFSNALQNRMKKKAYDNFYFFTYPERLKILGFYEKSNKLVATKYLHRKNSALFDENVCDYESKGTRKNRLTFIDFMEGIAAFFLRPVKSKIGRMMRN